MNDLQERWIEALRSGEYKQGHNALRHQREDEMVEHCCLGVLCDLVRPDDWTQRDTFDTPNWGKVRWNLLPHIPEAGISGHPDGDGLYAQKLSQMNDDHYTFGKIADFLEEHFQTTPERSTNE